MSRDAGAGMADTSKLEQPVVWFPAAIFLAVTASWIKAIILAGWGVIVIGSIDNLIYPALVGNKMGDAYAAGVFRGRRRLVPVWRVGIVLGPMVVAATDVLLESWRDPPSSRDARR